MAGVVVVTTAIILFLLFQKQLIRGIVGGAEGLANAKGGEHGGYMRSLYVRCAVCD